jgi:hypothetical protein
MEQIYEPISLDACCVEATYLLLVTPGIVLIIIVSHVVNRKVSPTILLLPAEPLRLDGAGKVPHLYVVIGNQSIKRVIINQAGFVGSVCDITQIIRALRICSEDGVLQHGGNISETSAGLA